MPSACHGAGGTSRGSACMTGKRGCVTAAAAFAHTQTRGKHPTWSLVLGANTGSLIHFDRLETNHLSGNEN